MLDVHDTPPSDWPTELDPLRAGDLDQESFDQWWERVGDRFSHLPKQLVEQWVHRHGRRSPFAFIDLDQITWRKVSWSTECILSNVHLAWGHEYNPDFDYVTFQGRFRGEKLPTAIALDKGTWDYPIIVLHTPAGIVQNNGERPDVRFVLVEGHCRMRYLNALQHRGVKTGPHEVFQLFLTSVSD